MKIATITVLGLMCQIVAFGNQEGSESNITKVTVYPSGAMIYRVAEIEVLEGENSIILDNLTTQIDINTIQVGGDGEFEISSMKYELYYPKSNAKPEQFKVVQDSIKKNEDALFLLKAEKKAFEEEQMMILTNRKINSEVGTNVADLTAMANYYRSRFKDISEELLRNKNQTNSSLKELERLRLVISGLNNYAIESVGRIILETRSKKKVQATIKFSYFTNAAYWKPTYRINASTGRDKISVKYNGLVTQNTGVDWVKVDLTLSTTRPKLDNQKPEIHPWFLDFYSPQSIVTYKNKLIDKSNTSSNTVVSEEDFANMAARSVSGNTAGVYSMDDGSGNVNIRGARSEANYYYIDGMKVQGSSPYGINDMYYSGYSQPSRPSYSSGELVFNALNTSYKIANKYTVLSNKSEKKVFVKTEEIPVELIHYTVPGMEEEAFLTAMINDWDAYDLVPGNATFFYNNTYVGKSFIFSNSVQDTLQISLGRDQGVLVKREKVKDLCTQKKNGGSIRKQFVYELVIYNTNKEEITIEIMDRIPVSKRNEIVVSEGDLAGASYSEETGFLRWVKTIPASGKEVIQFDYEVKYPKNKTINL